MTVVNKTYQNVDVELCPQGIYSAYTASTDANKCEKHALGPMHRGWPIDGTWNSADLIHPEYVQGIIRFDSVGVSFEAYNPYVGSPGFRLASAADSTPEALRAAHERLPKYAGNEPFMNDPKADDGSPTDALTFDENVSTKYRVNGHALQLERLPDSSWKEMRITILPLGE